MPRNMREEFFGSYIFSVHFVQMGTKTNLHPPLLKARTTSEDQKKKFACALQNVCTVIIGVKCQSPVSETFHYDLLKTELHR